VLDEVPTVRRADKPARPAQETDSATDAEEEIMKTLGVNIYELLELRDALLKRLQA
jgi:hypothetical protein